MPPISAEHAAFGRAVRELRAERLGISQEDFAHRCGLDRTYIGGIERGERNVGLANILRVADALQVRPSELMERFEGLATGS